MRTKKQKKEANKKAAGQGGIERNGKMRKEQKKSPSMPSVCT